MMKLGWLTTALFLITILASGLRADIPPDKGYTRVNVQLILQTDEDLPDYRFFLVSSNLVKEIYLKKGEKTTVASLGGGARYSSGAIAAIPAKDLTAFGADPAGEKLAELEAEISGYRVAGTIKLFTHSFSREIRDAEAGSVTDAEYRIEKTPNGLAAVAIAGVAAANNVRFGITDVSKPVNIMGWAMIVGGVLMSLAIVIVGLWAFLRVRKKSA